MRISLKPEDYLNGLDHMVQGPKNSLGDIPEIRREKPLETQGESRPVGPNRKCALSTESHRFSE